VFQPPSVRLLLKDPPAGHGSHLTARAAVIARRLLGLVDVVDVIVLQEVWHAGSADVLR